MIQDAGTGCIVLANKWDLVKRRISYEEFCTNLRYVLPGVSYAPVLFASAKTGYNYSNLIAKIFKVRESMQQEIPTSIVNRFFEDLVHRYSPPIVKGRALKIYYGLLQKVTPPTFKLFVNDKALCTRNYLTFMRNKIEDIFDFEGLPIRINLENRSRDEFHKYDYKK